ncbi:helix-turn-helix domain-containing protein [Gemella morbillorum]
MTTSDMIRELCEKKNISLAELARRIGQSPQNFNKKLKRGTVSFEEMMEIAKALNVRFEQAFVLSDGSKINMGDKQENWL